MTKRRVLWLLLGLAGLAVLALLIPGSPAYLPDLLLPKGMHEGHSVSYWIRALDSPDKETRAHALFALGAIGPEAAASVPRLAEILDNDPDRGCRVEASLALAKMGPAAQAGVPALTRALRDDFLLVRMNAVRALGRLGAKARPAVPALIAAIKDDRNCTNLGAFHITIQELATVTLGQISAGSNEGVPALMAVLEADSTSRMHWAAARGLTEVGAEAKPAVHLLRRLLRDKDADVRAAAEEALRKIGVPAGARASANKESLVGELKLPPEERHYLWEIEHHGNLLVKHGFRPLARALREADASALSRLLANNCAGADLNRPQRIKRSLALPGGGRAEVERVQDAGHPPLPRDRAALVARLLEFRRLFGSRPPRVKLALMALTPRRRGQLDGVWEGTAQLRLHGEHAPGAPAEVIALLRYRMPRPTLEILSRPGWLLGLEVREVMTACAPRYLFAEVAEQRGLNSLKLHDNWTANGFVPSPGGVYVCDFNGDGYLDVLVTDVLGCALYQGRAGGTFEDVTGRCGLPRSPGMGPAAAWADLDGDGYPDLLMAGRVFRNEGGKRFVDYTERCNLRLPADALNIIVADYDCDGRLDLYVTRSGRPGHTSWLDGKSDDPGGNYLFHNKGGWRFEDVSQASGTRCPRGSAFTAAWLDANNDGWPDLYVINEFGNGVLLLNNKDGTFSRQALADRPADFGSMGLAVGDVDNDGNIDIYCNNMYSKAGARVIGNLSGEGTYPPAIVEKMRRFVAGSQLHLNRGVRERQGVRSLQFEQVGRERRVAAVGWAYGAALADLDNDGWLDLYATAGYVSRNRDEPDG